MMVGMTENVQSTLAEAILGETLKRYGDTWGARRETAEELGISEQRLSIWLTRPTLPKETELPAVAKFLKIGSVYELGPMIVATMLERAVRTGKLKRRPK